MGLTALFDKPHAAASRKQPTFWYRCSSQDLDVDAADRYKAVALEKRGETMARHEDAAMAFINGPDDLTVWCGDNLPSTCRAADRDTTLEPCANPAVVQAFDRPDRLSAD
ncbi:MAG: hypothetical protein KF897_17055 [Opitutaceae bacterium]|nr:hypothetical protein [Opitutaceae bacterium]